MNRPRRNRNRAPRKGEAVSLGDALSHWLKLSGHGARLKEAEAEAAWREVMGEAVSRKTHWDDCGHRGHRRGNCDSACH